MLFKLNILHITVLEELVLVFEVPTVEFEIQLCICIAVTHGRPHSPTFICSTSIYAMMTPLIDMSK